MKFEYLILSGILFSLSMILFFRSRNLIMLLMSIELMLNSINIAIINLSWIKQSATVLVWTTIIFGITASEAAVGLAIIILISKKFKTIDINEVLSTKEEK